ncbi:MAG: anti-sigma factor [Rhizobiales bacterium]|nr:anti-sigma factor [Hyphomicrobiales bacterium]
MSDTDHNGPGHGDIPVAAEYVLGVLDAAERRAVEQRLAREPALAAEVAFWEARLGGMADAIPPVTPPARTWSAIERAIAARAGKPVAVRLGLWNNLAFWRGLTVATTGLAAASLVLLAFVAVQSSQRTPLVASLDASGGRSSFVAAVTQAGDSVMIVPAALASTDQRALELWLIPPGGKPHSLGLIEPGRPVRLNVPKELIAQVNAEAVLAVSLEPPGGSPTGQPTGPVIANGKLARL